MKIFVTLALCFLLSVSAKKFLKNVKGLPKVGKVQTNGQ